VGTSEGKTAVKHWQEMAQIVDRVVHLGREGKATALAIVVDIRGSAYRRPGAKLLIEGGREGEGEGDGDGDGAGAGAFLGGVSGGCLEEDVREIGLSVRRDGRARVLHYDTGSDETKLWGLGLGCDGEIDILVLPISPEAALGPWARARELLAGDAPFAVTTVVDEQSTGAAAGGVVVVGAAGRLAGSLADAKLDAAVAAAAGAALATRASKLETVGGRRVFTEVLLPPPKLLVCGAGDDARPVVRFAAAVGFRVFVADHRPAYLTRQRFPEAQALLPVRPEETAAAATATAVALPSDRDSYALVKTHSLARDTDWVRRLLATDIPYVGVLGPRSRIEKIENTLAAEGVSARQRLYGPVGLDLGADGPEQVGLAVVAELLAVRSSRTPRHLRERREAIHAG
jgi:xanthine dehydrogenase accessory factor